MAGCFLLSVIFLCSFNLSAANYELQKLSTVFVPKFNENGDNEFKLGTSNVEKLAYDAKEKTIYAAGGDTIPVIDISNPMYMILADYKTWQNTEITDIEFCNDRVVFTAVHNDSGASEDGMLYIIDKHRTNGTTRAPSTVINVGSNPDMVRISKDCSVILIALEGNQDIENYGGAGVGIVHLPYGITNTTDYTYTALNFTQYNNVTALNEMNVRFVYRENGTTFDRSADPEHITFNHDDSLAYVTLQDNNAIAVINITDKSISGMYGLGYKEWKDYKLDASDRDGGINMAPYNIKGIYSPKGTKYVKWRNQEILITANEGKIKAVGDWTEDERGSYFTDKLSDLADKNLIDALNDTALLGRLKFSKVSGKNENGTYDDLYSFGGRGFSIWSAADMSVIYDSGSFIEEKIAEVYPQVFNADADTKATPAEKRDTRSDDKGPECEALETGVLDDRLLIFLGCERPGVIFTFSIADDITKPRFESIYIGIPNFEVTYQDLFDQRYVSELDPEDIIFVPADDSPTGGPILLVTGEYSESVSIITITSPKPPPPPCSPIYPAATGSSTFNLPAPMLFTALLWFLEW